MAFFAHLGKKSSRFQFDILIHDVEGVRLPPNAEKPGDSFYCTCERGSKRFRTKSTTLTSAGSLRWFEVS